MGLVRLAGSLLTRRSLRFLNRRYRERKFNGHLRMANITLQTCPRGFITQPLGFIQTLNSRSFCLAGCCVPCPFQGPPLSTPSLKPETMFPSFISKYRAVDAIAFTSMLCISLVLLAYILIPTASKSNMQKFSVAASVFILTSTKTFTMFQSYNSTFCANSIQGATFHNARCGVQAFILAFGIHSSVLWASMRAYTVLALITYQRNSKSVRWTVGSNVVCWGVPLCFASGTIGSRSVGYAFGGSCAARTNLQVGLFLVPPIVCPC